MSKTSVFQMQIFFAVFRSFATKNRKIKKKRQDFMCTAPGCTDSTKKCPYRKMLSFKQNGAD